MAPLNRLSTGAIPLKRLQRPIGGNHNLFTENKHPIAIKASGKKALAVGCRNTGYGLSRDLS
jgi:hypothetical protein